jgi:PAT family acetyl-CoA transporter-like MFS transporter 1
VLFKKYLTYTEIGQIMVCTMPFSFKVLYSPFVEFYHLPALGKRRSWIVPAQLILCGLLYYLRANLELMLETKQVGTLSYLLLFLVFVITVQDIAVDCWAIEMLHPSNASLAS